MRNVFLPVLFVCLFLLGAAAQSNYVKGYVVTTQRDTVQGYIDETRLESAVDQVRFKKELSDEPVLYTPLQVLAFALLPAQETYVGKVVSIDKTPAETGQLLEASSHIDFLKKSQPVPDTVFLETLLRGKISLFRYTDFKTHYFIQKGPGEVQELVSQRYVLNANGARQIRNNEAFKAQLEQFMDDSPASARSARNAVFSQNSLQKIITAYNEAMGEAVVSVKQTPRNPSRLGLVAGATNTTLTIKSNAGTLDFDHSLNPAFGLYYDLPLLRKVPNWSVYNELAYKGYRVENRAARFETQSLRLHNLVRYQYVRWAVKPFVQVGISNAYAWRNDNYRKQGVTLTDAPYLEQTRRYEQGLLAGIGFALKRISVEGRFETTNGMSEYEGIRTNAKTAYLLVGYRLK